MTQTQRLSGVSASVSVIVKLWLPSTLVVGVVGNRDPALVTTGMNLDSQAQMRGCLVLRVDVAIEKPFRDDGPSVPSVDCDLVKSPFAAGDQHYIPKINLRGGLPPRRASA